MKDDSSYLDEIVNQSIVEKDMSELKSPQKQQLLKLNISPILLQVERSPTRMYGYTSYKPNFLKRLVYIMNFIRSLKYIVQINILNYRLITYNFLYFLKQQIKQKNLKLLSDHFFSLINDKSSQLITKKNKILDRRFSIFNKFQKLPIKIFQPENILNIIFNFLQFFSILTQCFWLPIQLILDIKIEKSTFIVLSVIYCIIFSFYTLIHLNTAIYLEGMIVQDRISIIKQYLRFPFLIDLLGTIFLFQIQDSSQILLMFIVILRICQFFVFIETSSSNYQLKQTIFILINFLIVKFIFYQNKILKYVLLIDFYQNVNSYFFILKLQSSSRYPSMKLVKMIVLLLLSAHYFACGFLWIGSNSIQKANWIQVQNLQNCDWVEKYLNSLYFSFVTMITVGFGDIAPINMYEKIYVMVITLFNCGLFAYCINSIGEMFKVKEEEKMSFMKQQLEVFKYMKSRGVSIHVQNKVMKQLEHIHFLESNKQGEHLIDKLRDFLRNQVKSDIYENLLQDNLILKNTFSQKFLSQMSLFMKEVILYPNQILHVRGDQVSRLYMIKKGFIQEIFEKEAEQIIQSKQVGQTICFERFISEQQFTSTLKSENISTLMYIEYEDFLKLISNFPEDYERFCMVRDLYKQKLKNYYFSYEQCKCCFEFYHVTSQCPCVTFRVNQEIVIKRHIFSVDQKRNSWMRKNNRVNCKSALSEIKNRFKQLRINYLQKEQLDDIIQNQNTDVNEFIQILSEKEFVKRLPILQHCQIQSQNFQEEETQMDENEDCFQSQQNKQESQDFFENEEVKLTKHFSFRKPQKMNSIRLFNKQESSNKDLQDDQLMQSNIFTLKTQQTDNINDNQQSEIIQKNKRESILVNRNSLYHKRESVPVIKPIKEQDETITSLNQILITTEREIRDKNRRQSHKFEIKSAHGRDLQQDEYSDKYHRQNLNQQISNINNINGLNNSELFIKLQKLVNNFVILKNSDKFIAPNQYSQKRNEDYFDNVLIDFDKIKEYKINFPNANYTNTIENYRKKVYSKARKENEKSLNSRKTTLYNRNQLKKFLF